MDVKGLSTDDKKLMVEVLDFVAMTLAVKGYLDAALYVAAIAENGAKVVLKELEAAKQPVIGPQTSE